MSRPTLRRFFGFLFGVPRCTVCRTALAVDEALGDLPGCDVLCPFCRAEWEREKLAACPVCAVPQVRCRCMPDALRDAGAATLLHLGEYRADGAIGRFVLRLKDARLRRAADFAAGELLPGVCRAAVEAGVEPTGLCVVFLPRGRGTRLRIGHDQAELLARALARRLGAGYRPCIVRARSTAAQKKLSAEARLANVSGAFALKPGTVLRGQTALLVDDIVTTGASMAEGVRLLRAAGAETVICASLGLSPRKTAEKTQK